MDFVRPGIVAEASDPVIENLAALAAGMTAGKIYKVVAVYCPHRKRTVLQQVHDNDVPTTEQTQQHSQAQSDHDAAWARLGHNSNTNIATITTAKEETPDNALRIQSDDSVRKALLTEFDEQSEQRMQLAVAEHAKAIYEPKLADLQQKLREQNLARETESRQLATLIQQLLDQTQETKENKEANKEQSTNYPPEATLDSWAESAELLLGKTANNKTRQDTLKVKIDTPDEQDEEYIQLRIKCEAYEI